MPGGFPSGKIETFGKTYHATGWKIGYCLAPAELTTELRKVHQYLTFAATTPIQAEKLCRI